MKKQILISLILLSSILTINGQTWSGTTTSNVGIGTNTPQERLSVQPSNDVDGTSIMAVRRSTGGNDNVLIVSNLVGLNAY